MEQKFNYNHWDLQYLRDYCMEHGKRWTFERDETLEDAGEPGQWNEGKTLSY